MGHSFGEVTGGASETLTPYFNDRQLGSALLAATSPSVIVRRTAPA